MQNAKFSTTTFVAWEPIRPGRTDGRRAQFLGPLYDNHPFGNDNYNATLLEIVSRCNTLKLSSSITKNKIAAKNK